MSDPTSGTPSDAAAVPGSPPGPAGGAPPPGVMPPPVATRKRPGALTFLVVMAMILGFLGGITSVTNGVSFIRGYEAALEEANSGTEFAAKFNPMMTPAALEAQKQMTAAATKATFEYRGISIIVALVNLVLCLGLIVGGIWTLQIKEKGRNLLAWTCMAHLPYQLLATVVGWLVAGAAMEASRPFMGQLMAAQGGGQAALGDSLADFTAMAAKVFMVIVAILLLSYYIWALTYLRKDTIKQICL